MPISVPNHSRDSLILFKLNSLYSCKECIKANWSKWYISLNWTYLYDADVFPSNSGFDSASTAHFRPESLQRFINFIQIELLYSCKECIRANWSKWYISLNWTYLYDADVFPRFRVLIRLLLPISVPNHSRDSLILFKLNFCTHAKSVLGQLE